MEHEFPYKWYLKDGYPAKNIEKNNMNVFGTFVCGGGSTMGYKLAGYNHLGGVEIDEKIAVVYRKNHNPKHFYNMDVRDFNKLQNIPDELFDLDLLDGSPPCSTFSMAGKREKAWNKKKKFREGQANQVLDDLVFVYLDTIKKLKPKVALLENVKGLMQGNAKGYLKEIYKRFTNIGYRVQVFLLDASTMGVPQRRQRVFIIGLRNDFCLPKLVLGFNEDNVVYGDISGDMGDKITAKTYNIWKHKIHGDGSLSDTLLRVKNIQSLWSSKYIYKNKVCNTIASTSGGQLIEFDNPNIISNEKLIQIGSFPLDYDFQKIKPRYLIGMSVPPVMTAQIAHQIYLQWLSKM